MKKKENLLILWALSAFVLLIALTLSTVTYAWFTSNRKVETDKISAKTGSTITLEISRSENPFKVEKNSDGDSEAPLKAHDERLYPVSTADLAHFWRLKEGSNEEYELDTKEEYYYHDTVYLRATGEDLPEDTKLDLYLDNDEKKFPIVRSDDGQMQLAARLGLKIGGNSWIVKLSDAADNRPEDSDEWKTYLDGEPLPAGQVLGHRIVIPEGPDKTPKDTPFGTADPAVSLSILRLDPANPDKTPLITMELNKIYQVDVYFYLEGCDPDCVTDTVGLTEASLSLAFFGMQK